MKLRLGYTNQRELISLYPIISKTIESNLEFDLVYIRGDELKFKLGEVDLAFIPLPVLAFINNIKFISNGAFTINRLGIRLLGNSITRLCIYSSNSTEYYLFKLLTNFKIPIEIIKDKEIEKCDAIISYDDYDISIDELWKSQCGDLPIVISMLGTIKLQEELLVKAKVAIRESAVIQERSGNILPYSKELGLKGRQSIDCFFQLCSKKGLCNSNIKPYIL
ncbi:MAG: hypothetical protein QXR34_02105 [Saccharolobus sp.]